MGQGRWRRLADLLRDASRGVEVGPAVAAVAAELLGADDVSLTLVVAGVPTSTVGSSDDAVALCRRQFTLGEGPSVDAMRTGEPTLVADLATAGGMPGLLDDAVVADVGADASPASPWPGTHHPGGPSAASVRPLRWGACS